jgi:hypothetical protein
VLSDVSSQIAFRKALASVTKKGYKIANSDEKVGVISATQTTSGDRTMPLELHIESVSGTGTKIDFSFSIASGILASEDGVRNEFCKITSAVLSNTEPDVAKSDSTKSDSDKKESGGLFKAINGVLNPKNETVKVEGLIAANLHTTCPTHREKIGGQWLIIPCSNKVKDGDLWIATEDVLGKKGRPDRNSDYSVRDIDEEGSVEAQANRLARTGPAFSKRLVFYYDSQNKTEVFVFGNCMDNSCQLLDDFVTSAPNFVLKHDRAM